MPLLCNQCGASFARDEHLQRHQRRHLDIRPYSCRECSSTFTRKDTLNQHLLTHNPAHTSHRPRRVAYVAKACVCCAKSKQRCDGHSPCGRCALKSLECFYRPLRHKRQLSPSSASPSSAISTERESHLHDALSLATGQVPLVPPEPELRPQTRASADMSDLPPVSTDLGSPSVVVRLDPAQEATPVGNCEHPNDLATVVTESFTGTGEGLGYEDWISLGMDYSWDNIFDTAALGLPQPMSFFFQTSNEIVDQSGLYRLPSLMHSEPMVHDLECEAPTPRFTRSMTIQGSERLDRLSSCKTASHINPLASADPEPWRAEDYGHVPYMTNEAYDVMASAFEQLNSDNGYCVPFTNKNLPPLQHMQIYMQVYFEEFHPIFPLLHKATFSPTRDDWLLNLAISSIGCLFSKTLPGQHVYPLMQEFLRRAIHIQVEKNQMLEPNVSIAQASVLNQIGMMYSGDLRLAECAHKTMAQLATQCIKIASYFDGSPKPSVTEHAASQDWQAWIKAELLVRLFCCSWLVDRQQVGFFAFPSTLPPDFLGLSMPVHDSIWDMPDQDAWKQSLKEKSSSQQSISLRQMLLNLYRYQEVPGHLGAFNSLLLAMGVVSDAPRLRHAHSYLVTIQRHIAALPPSSLTRASINQIHMASLILYFPTKEIIAFMGWRVTEIQHSMVVQRLKRWMSNSCDARIALIYACTVWSQIRTSHTAAQHVAPSLLYSAVAIWALLELSDQAKVGESEDLPTIRLESITPDVRDWAAGTEKRRLFLGGVGFLQHQGAVSRLINETANLLGSLRWPQGYQTGPYLRECWLKSSR